MLINFSNENSSNWITEQLKSATEIYGKIIDLPLPKISPDWTTEEVKAEVKKYYEILSEIISLSEDKKSAVMVAGEFTFCFLLVEKLKKRKVEVVVPTFMITTTGVKKRVTERKFVMFRSCF